MRKNPEFLFKSEILILLQPLAVPFAAGNSHDPVNYARRLVQPQELNY